MLNDSDSNNIIVFKNVGKVYDKRDIALRNVSFEVKNGEFVCIIGPSGSGKSTILKIIAGLEKEDSGTVQKPENISMVFQLGALFPWLTVLQNVEIGLEMKKISMAEARKRSLMYLDMMGLKDYIERHPRELSGGQRQRVGVARALAVDPDVLLLDEPFSALDAKTTEELHMDIVKIWQETKKTIVMVSHLIEEAVAIAERVILVKDATIEKEFSVILPRPRREQGGAFQHEVVQMRREFFK